MILKNITGNLCEEIRPTTPRLPPSADETPGHTAKSDDSRGTEVQPRYQQQVGKTTMEVSRPQAELNCSQLLAVFLISWA